MATYRASDLRPIQAYKDRKGNNNIRFIEIPLQTWRGADGAALGVSESAGDFFLEDGTNQWILRGEEAASETETSVAKSTIMVPTGFDYSRGDHLRVRVSGLVNECCGAVDGGSSIDLSVYESVPTTGAVGCDLVISDSQTVDSCGAELDFELDASGLVAGDVLVLVLTGSAVESCGTAMRIYVTKTQLLVVSS